MPLSFKPPVHTAGQIAHLLVRNLTGILTVAALATFDLNVGTPGWTMRLAFYALILVAMITVEIMAHRHPISGHLALGAFSLLTLGLILNHANPTAVIVLFFVYSVYAQEIMASRPAYAWTVAFGLITMVYFTLLQDSLLQGVMTGLTGLGGYLFIGSAARNRQLAEDAQAESLRLLQELQTAHDELTHYAREAEYLAAAEERNCLARELHDTLGHRLTVAAVQLEGAQRLIGRDAAKAGHMVEVVRGQVLEGLAELRQTVAALRTPLEADLRLAVALPRLTSQFAAATGLDIQVELSPAAAAQVDRLTRTARHTLFRATQEGLTNVQKHAKATAVHVRLEVVEEDTPAIRLTLADNGRGPAGSLASQGFGVRGLQERAAHLGGRVEFTPGTTGGSRLTVTLPLPLPDTLQPAPHTALESEPS